MRRRVNETFPARLPQTRTQSDPTYPLENLPTNAGEDRKPRNTGHTVHFAIATSGRASPDLMLRGPSPQGLSPTVLSRDPSTAAATHCYSHLQQGLARRSHAFTPKPLTTIIFTRGALPAQGRDYPIAFPELSPIREVATRRESLGGADLPVTAIESAHTTAHIHLTDCNVHNGITFTTTNPQAYTAQWVEVQCTPRATFFSIYMQNVLRSLSDAPPPCHNPLVPHFNAAPPSRRQPQPYGSCFLTPEGYVRSPATPARDNAGGSAH
jgi:hypothetical protein